MEKEREEILLEKAYIKEKNYDWLEAAKLYEQVAISFLDDNLEEKAAETYRILGYTYLRATETIETSEEYIELNKHAINAYNKGANLFKLTGNKAKELECEAECFYINGIIADSITEGKELGKKSYEVFIKSSEIYSKKKDQESIARTLNRTAMALMLIATYSSERAAILEACGKGVEIARKAWNLSKNIGNVQTLVESFLAEFPLVYYELFITDFKRKGNWKENMKKIFLRCEESLELAKSTNDFRLLGIVSQVFGNGYCAYGIQFTRDENEQNKCLDKGLKLMEESLIFAKKAKDNERIIHAIFWLDWFAIAGARFNYVQKRILNDVREVLNLGRIYSGVYSTLCYYTNLLPANYYANIAQRSFLPLSQRKSYANKGIEYAKKALEKLPFKPFSPWIYQVLIWCYSQLTILATEKNERNKYAQKMLQYGKQAKDIGEQYEGGFARAAGYSTLYRAYKTLADIAENKEDKIKMLSAAVEASKKYMEHAVEHRTGILRAQMRLGLLYEDISILAGEIDLLMQAKNTFLQVIKESLERGYDSYAAATHEYIARIEDRMGNYMVSAENYEKALQAYKNSLKAVEYKPLKDRINEKVSYASAWNLIEKAKEYHKRENHFKAKEYYKKSSEILNKLPNYNYEAPYYFAWNLLEESEELSKQEKHKEAIERYEITIKSFNEAFDVLDKMFIKSKDEIEKNRINKLGKVAKVRIDYCSARANLEKARLLGKRGDHLAAAEKFASAAAQFRNVCKLFKIERERLELEAVYYLCRAWESMELAENYEDPERFSDAANLFTKASKLLTETKLKLLASGNSTFCQALEYGCKFDESTKTEIKAQLYPNIKIMLRKAASSYRKGGFESAADWALATSSYFDATWNMIRADMELNLEAKKKLLNVGSEILRSTAELFSKAGYKNKEKEVLDRLKMIEKEEKIIMSALNTIKEPSISKSTLGIIAPACPIESSLSSKISEARQFTDEQTRVIEKREGKEKYALIYKDLLKIYPKIQRRECRIAIAQIGVSKTGDILSEFYEEKTFGLLGLKENKINEIKSKVKEMINKANKLQVNVLIFPEMTIDLNYEQFLEEISNLAKLYEMYIIPGSYHDKATKHNLSIVIGPEGILWEQEKHIPAIIHFEGKKFKEGIEVSSYPRKTFICNTEFGRIAIVICRDFLDMDLRVELKNFEPPVDIILNPAFTPVTADFEAAHFDARRSIYSYCFFANVAEFGNSLIYTPEKERIGRKIPSKMEDLIYKDVDLFKLRSERKKWEKEKMKEKQFIQSTR